MTKTYCDRCGKEIQGSKYALLRHKTWYAVQRLIPSFMRDDWKDTDKYICPDCEEQYIHWFMNPKPPKEGWAVYKLKPCPFCGELCDGVEKMGTGWYATVCSKCKAYGPHAISPEKALKLWNGRVDHGLDKQGSGD